jgi:molybdate transport system substrate-binding protein
MYRPTLRAQGARFAARAQQAAKVRVRPLVALPLLLAALLLLPLVAGCGEASSGSEGESTQITVFAAASLTDAFTRLGETYTVVHPGTTVRFSFAGSQDLVAQLQQGAPADVLATADTKTMAMVGDAVDTSATFAGNKLVIVVAPGDPEGIESLNDLARKDLKVVLAAPEVPAGKYAQEVLDRAGVTVHPVSLEVSVKGVVTKVSLGEADAGIVYVTDVSAAGGAVDGVAIPDADNVVATYPIAVVTASAQAEAAQAFVDLVLSEDGQAVLKDYGFLPPGTQ